MATQLAGQPAEPNQSPQHYVPPSARELRGQAVQRLQVGLFGLAAMLLLVGLANIIMDRARLVEAEAGNAPVAEGKAEPKSDPLADIGVIPAPAPDEPVEGAPAGKNN